MKKGLIYLSLVGMVFGFMAFSCASAELTGAKLYIQQKQMAKAKEALLKEVQKNPASDEGWYILGTLYGEENDITKMLDAFDNSVKASKKFEPQIKEAELYYWATSFNKGVSYFNSAIKSSTADSTQKYFGKAEEMFRFASLCQPDSVLNYTNLAMVHINMNKTDEAIKPLETAVKIGKASEAFYLLGQIYMDKASAAKTAGDEAKSKEYLDKAIAVLEGGQAKYPEDGEILSRYSNALILSGNKEKAISTFKTGIAREPNNKFYRYNYGVVLLESNNYAEAEEQFLKCISIDPNYTNAIYNIGVTYVKWGTSFREEAEKKSETVDEAKVKEKYNLALPHIKKYLDINPKEPALWELLGKIYANLGMKTESDDAFKKADENR